MKFFIMLTAILSVFFIFSCGGSDSGTSGGISESEFYTTVAIQTCEKGFDCNIDYLKTGHNDKSECKDITSQGNCTQDFNGVKAKECNDCVAALTCDEFDQGNGQATKCPICSEVCVYKP